MLRPRAEPHDDTPDGDVLAMLHTIRRRAVAPDGAAFVERMRRGPGWIAELPARERDAALDMLDELIAFAERAIAPRPWQVAR